MTRVRVAPAVGVGLVPVREGTDITAEGRLPRDNRMLYRGEDGPPAEIQSVDD